MIHTWLIRIVCLIILFFICGRIELKYLCYYVNYLVTISLPEDYKQFLLDNNGGYPECKENYIVIPNITSEKIKLCWFGGVTESGELVDYEKNLFYITAQEYGAMIDHSEFIPFAKPYGYFGLLLGVSEERSGIWLYDYQVRLKESSKKKVVHKICDTFTEFLGLIYPVEN